MGFFIEDTDFCVDLLKIETVFMECATYAKDSQLTTTRYREQTKRIPITVYFHTYTREDVPAVRQS